MINLSSILPKNFAEEGHAAYVTRIRSLSIEQYGKLQSKMFGIQRQIAEAQKKVRSLEGEMSTLTSQLDKIKAGDYSSFEKAVESVLGSEGVQKDKTQIDEIIPVQ